MPDNKKNPKTKRTPTVEETNAALEKEFAGTDSKGKDPLPESGSELLESPMQTSPSKAEKVEETLSEVNAMGSENLRFASKWKVADNKFAPTRNNAFAPTHFCWTNFFRVCFWLRFVGCTDI